MNGNAAEAISAQNKTQEQGNSPFANNDPMSEAIDIMEGRKPVDNEGDPKPEPTINNDDDNLSRKFSEIAKIETKYQGEIRKLKEQIESLSQSSEGKLTKDELLAEIKQEFNQNPREFLEKKLESSYDNLSDFILNEETRVQDNETKSLINSLKEEIDSLKNERNQEKESQKSLEVQQKEQQFKDNIKNFVSEKEEFGLVSNLDLSETVFDVMMNYYEENGKTMDINEACSQVENFYLEEVKKIAKLPKVKSLLQLDNTNDNTSEETNSDRFFENSETLTSGDTSSNSSRDLEDMSLDERMKLAVSML